MPTSQFITSTDGLKLHVATLGDPANTPIVLVHGYPDNHQVWLPVAELLAYQFFVIAYDVRGAGRSESGRQVSDYSLDQLSQDLMSVADAVIPGRRFHLVGHDWGSIQSWESVTTERLRDRIASYTTISGPALDHAAHWMRTRLSPASSLPLKERLKAVKQFGSSWYVVMFQLPVLAPTLWQAGLGKLWPKYLKHREGVEESTPNPTQIEDGKEGVQLYRANFLPKLANPEPRYASCPVQLIVPRFDNYASHNLYSDLSQWVPELYRRDIDATHWVVLSHHALIAQWITEFVSACELGEQDSLFAHLRANPSEAA